VRTEGWRPLGFISFRSGEVLEELYTTDARSPFAYEPAVLLMLALLAWMLAVLAWMIAVLACDACCRACCSNERRDEASDSESDALKLV